LNKSIFSRCNCFVIAYGKAAPTGFNAGTPPAENNSPVIFPKTYCLAETNFGAGAAGNTFFLQDMGQPAFRDFNLSAIFHISSRFSRWIKTENY
jgi:hypothetical protein